MKTVYEKPEMEIVDLESADVILTSTPDPNEGPFNDDF